MASYFQAKRDLWGDDLLIHRITWNDVRDEPSLVVTMSLSTSEIY